MTTTWLAVEPLDTVMVRDGRMFDAGASSAARAVAPPPSTLGGVVRASVGANVERILGPVVTTDGVAVFPAPLDLVRDEAAMSRLAVATRSPDEMSDVDESYRLTHHLVGLGDPVEAWITGQGLGDWLQAESPVTPGVDVTRWATVGLAPVAPWLPERRLGLARRWSGPLVGTTEPGMLYTMSHLRPRAGVRFMVGCVDRGPVTVAEDVVPLGGRGRVAHVAVVDAGDVLPERLTSFPGGRVAVYLATPALLDDVLWHPPDARLCALAVSGAQAVATASERMGFAGSRQLVWAVPAGSVFYLQFSTEGAALAWVQRHHGDLLPHQMSVPIMTAGFGLCLAGRW